ncbi:MAG: hypothetical protein OHK0050_44770 [Roseiflexaceae bacterium]
MPVWNPAQTWAVVVGCLEWEHADLYDPFPQTERRDVALVELLKQRGVPAKQIAYLQDQQATTAAIQRALKSHLAAAPAGSTCLIYYCGHGAMLDDGRVVFASYDASDQGNLGWAIDELPDQIDRSFAGSHAILLADCCHSGHLAAAIQAKPRRVAYACLASSLASELSTGNWTFTEAILAALRGEAYTDRDGSTSISLAELASHIEQELAFAEEQVATFATTATFDPQLVMAEARPRRDPQIGRNVAVLVDKTWYLGQVIDTRKGALKVRYYGYNSDDDQWIAADQIRIPGRPRYPIGSTVEVQWKQRWFLSTVLDERNGIHQIGYEGYGPEWSEWVSSQRIRPIA